MRSVTFLRLTCLLALAAGVGAQPKDKKYRKVNLPLSLKGDVYLIENGTRNIPDFSTLTPAATKTRKKLDIAPRDDDELSGIRDRTEWFAIDFQGTFTIKKQGTYVFRLTSDDGSKLFVDDKLLIDNDGLHPPKTEEGEAPLDAGEHRMRVQYFQGPAGMALILETYMAPE